MYECKICGEEYKGIASHVYQSHGLPISDYYTEYIDPEDRLCSECGDKCDWKGKGVEEAHYTFCSCSCTNSGENHPLWGKSREFTEEWKQKIAEAHEGRNWPDEHGQKISEALKGKPKSQAHIRKVSEALSGRSLSELQKEKLRGPRPHTRGENNHRWKSEEEEEAYEEYCRKVDNETRQLANTLREIPWGECHYCSCSLVELVDKKSRFYLTVDHQTPKIYGFENGIDPEVIGREENRVLCCRSCNTKKGPRTAEEFEKEA